MNLRGLVKKFIPTSLFVSIEPYGHFMEALLFNIVYRFPGRKFKIVGVTGTNGKTTTSFMIHRLLLNSGYKVGLMTTVAWGANDDIRPQVHHMTNVPVPELMKRLKALKAAGVEWLVFETTSQGLAQNRVWGVPYSLAVITNVTHEHLDYHRTFERYRAAKLKLFRLTNQNIRGKRVGIINADDPSAKLFASAIAHPITYGIKAGDLKATNIKLSPSGVSYQVMIDHQAYKINCRVAGSFNVYNSLAAVTVGHVLKLSKDQVEQGIAALSGVEGRMTRIDEGQNFTVLVDFAHTPDSFEKLFKDLRPVVEGSLIVMFGSPGRRDEGKRAEQGSIAAKYADEIVLTEEDDRDVDGMEIINQIAEAAEKVGKIKDKDLFIVHDRSQAMEFAMRRANKSSDIVLLLGKGHEKTIERSDGEHPWDEIGLAHQTLKKIKK